MYLHKNSDRLFKDATNKHIISIITYNHLCDMFTQFENGTIKSPKLRMDLMDLANRFLSTSPMTSSNEILKNINKYLNTMLKNDETVATAFNNDPTAKQTLDKIQKLDDYIVELQEQQE